MKKVFTISLLFVWVAFLTAKPHTSALTDRNVTPSVLEPDLTVEMISAQNNNYSQGASSEIALKWRVKTTQDLPNTAQVKLNILISPDANPANGQLILSINYSGAELKAAQPREDNRTFTNPTGSPAFPLLIGNVLTGINYAFVSIDVDNQIVELNENNNMSNQIAFNYKRIDCFSRGIEPWQEWISGVKFNTIDNPSSKTRYGYGIYIADGYSYFKDIKTTVQSGQTYPLSITPGVSWYGRNSDLHYRAWIDFNGNGVFDDAGETILQQNTGNNTATQNVLIPTNARSGTFTMRISMKGGSYPMPCETFQLGEVEDYTVEITEGTPTTGRDTLRFLSVTGQNNVSQGGQITLNVTLKNTGTAASSPTTPLSIYQNQQPFSFQGPQSTCFNLVSLRQPINRVIQPNETVTLPITFTVNGDFTNKNPLVYPPITFGNTQITVGNRDVGYCIPLYNMPNVDTIFYLFNIIPTLDNGDLSIKMTTTDATYGSDGRYAYQLTVMNKGIKTVKSVVSQVSQSGAATFQTPLVTPQRGTTTISQLFGDFYTLWHIGDLAAGESVTAMVQFADPSLSSITSSIEKKAYVYSNQIVDVVGTNDRDTLKFTFRGQSNLPDLTLSDLTTPSVGTVGQYVDFTFRLKNIGNAIAVQPYTIGCYLSTDNNLSADDVLVGIVPTANTPIGFNVVVPADISIPANFATGNYYLIVKVDKDNTIFESNENNNIVSTPFDVRGISGTYCLAKANFPWEQWIEHVSVATGIGSTSFPATVKDSYGNFTNATAANIQLGQAVLITIDPKSSWNADPRNANMFWRAWIDLNNDDDFDDAGEMVVSRQVVISYGTFLDNEQAFVLPATATLGKTRMRIAMKVGSYPSPCETFDRGEVEDYSVNIVNPTSTVPSLMAFGNLKAQIVDAAIRLDWVRLSDKIVGFEVEKSTNGQTFQFMEKVVVSPFESYYYAYDRQLTEGTHFYRLKITLNNGGIQYSTVQRIDYQVLADFLVFPNPTTDAVFVDLKKFENKAIKLSVSNAIGHLVLTEQIANANRAPHALDVSMLESGLYYIRVEAVGKRAVVRKLQVLK